MHDSEPKIIALEYFQLKNNHLNQDSRLINTLQNRFLSAVVAVQPPHCQLHLHRRQKCFWLKTLHQERWHGVQNGKEKRRKRTDQKVLYRSFMGQNLPGYKRKNIRTVAIRVGNIAVWRTMGIVPHPWYIT